MKGCMICMEHDRSGSRGVAKLLSAERNTFHIKSRTIKMLSWKNCSTLLDPPLLETTWVGEKQVVTATGQFHNFRFCNGVEPLVDLLNFQPFWTFAVFCCGVCMNLIMCMQCTCIINSFLYFMRWKKTSLMILIYGCLDDLLWFEGFVKNVICFLFMFTKFISLFFMMMDASINSVGS